MLELKDARVEANMTGKDVAKIVGITQQHYNFIENGKRRPSVDVAKKIGAALGFDWTRFFEDELLEKEG